MNVIVFGATGMIGQGVLRECLLAPDVNRVLSIGRSATGVRNAKLQDLVHADLWNYSAIEEQLRGFDACFFCLGVTSAGMSEADYTRVTYGITVAAAETLCRLNPDMRGLLYGLCLWSSLKNSRSSGRPARRREWPLPTGSLARRALSYRSRQFIRSVLDDHASQSRSDC